MNKMMISEQKYVRVTSSFWVDVSGKGSHEVISEKEFTDK